jgi:hypothetical protein
VSDGLVAFLRARLAEREQALRALAAARLTEDELPELARGPMLLIQAAPDGREAEAFRELLADIEAKRRILDRYVAAEEHAAGTYDEVSGGIAQGLEFAVRAHAHAHAEHPDYRPEWAPST